MFWKKIMGIISGNNISLRLKQNITCTFYARSIFNISENDSTLFTFAI